MICDRCQAPIQKGEPYSLTEHGRLHASCLHQAHGPWSRVEGPLQPATEGTTDQPSLERADPVYVLQRL